MFTFSHIKDNTRTNGKERWLAVITLGLLMIYAIKVAIASQWTQDYYLWFKEYIDEGIKPFIRLEYVEKNIAEGDDDGSINKSKAMLLSAKVGNWPSNIEFMKQGISQVVLYADMKPYMTIKNTYMVSKELPVVYRNGTSYPNVLKGVFNNVVLSYIPRTLDAKWLYSNKFSLKKTNIHIEDSGKTFPAFDSREKIFRYLLLWPKAIPDYPTTAFVKMEDMVSEERILLGDQVLLDGRAASHSLGQLLSIHTVCVGSNEKGKVRSIKMELGRNAAYSPDGSLSVSNITYHIPAYYAEVRSSILLPVQNCRSKANQNSRLDFKVSCKTTGGHWITDTRPVYLGLSLGEAVNQTPDCLTDQYPDLYSNTKRVNTVH